MYIYIHVYFSSYSYGIDHSIQDKSILIDQFTL